MGSVADAVGDFIGDVIDAIVNIVSVIWNQIVMPILEFVFSIFGIVDEEVITVQKTSTLLFGENDVDVVNQASVKAVMSMMHDGGSYFPWYMKYTRTIKAQMTAFYRYADRGKYIHGLPNMEIYGGQVDYDAIDAALDIEIGVASTRLSVATERPSDELHYKNLLQATPTFYLPWANTLTYDDQYSVSWDDYRIDSVEFNVGTGDYDISISRTAEEALFWIEGPVHIVEGDSATYTIKSNREVPVGESITINLAYTGTAPGTDYNEVASVVMLAETSEIDAVVTTVENVAADGSRTIIVTIDSVENTDAAFEEVGIHTIDSVTTTITDDEGIILTMSSIVIAESSGPAVVTVKLEEAATGGFTVDYDFTDVTALEGIDYTGTADSLVFVGTAGETHDITIPITTPDGDDDGETFEVYFTACDDGDVDISYVCTITIDDGTDVDPAADTVEVYDIITKAAYTSEQALTITYHKDTDPSTEWFYWVYILSDNTYPEIDPTTTILSNMDMFPIAILKSLGVEVNDDKTSDEYITTKKLLDTVDLDIEDILENAATNDSYSAVQDMFINFAVSPFSEVEIVSQALWLNFHAIIVTNGVTSNTNQYTAAFSEQSVNNAVVWSDQSHEEGITGKLPNCQLYYHKMIDDVLIIRCKTGAFEYSEIRVSDLAGMAAIVKDGYHAVAWSAIGDEHFTIPLSHFLVTEMDPLDQMRLYPYSLRLDAYALDVTELEWYKTSIFMSLFKLVMIIVTIFTAGATSGVYAVVQAIVTQLLIIELVTYIAELTGNHALAAIVGVIATMYLGAGAELGFASPEGMLTASTNFCDNITAAHSVEIQKLADDIRQLNKDVEARMEEIESAGDEGDNPITAEFLVALKSVNTQMFPSISAQYDFDLCYDYDRLVADYYDVKLKLGVA